MLNDVKIQGRIPATEKIPYTLYNESDEKRCVLQFKVSVRRNYKAADEKYYPEDLIDCKAFGKTAQNLYAKYKQGDYVLLEGALMKDDNREVEGVMHYGGLFVRVNNFHYQFVNGETDGETAAPTAAPAKAAVTARPAIGKTSAALKVAPPKALGARPSLLRK